MNRSLRVALYFGCFLAGCTAIVDADQRKLGPSPCDAKDPPAVCLCVDGTPSVQTCNATGRYEPCRCPTIATPPVGSAGSAAR